MLSKDFVNLYVDTSKVPGGKELHDSYPRSKKGGIPWFVVLDGEGKELGDSNGPKGNIGCPNSDEEIEVFMELVKKVSVALTDEDRALLRKSLVDHRDKK